MSRGSRLSGLSFDTLRIWDGAQSRAFEELSFQLLKDRVPGGMRAIRTGNPDGGVEWYATRSDGSEWGWQAKHVKGIDALLTAMTGSVKRVAKERPELRKLIFVISSNLATSTRGGERKSQREKYLDKVETWRKTIDGADQIEFELVQESDLLDELAKPEHKGRRWFWWGDLVFGHEWLVMHYEQQAAAASEKYRPDLQVDVPIQEDLLALGFDKSTLDVFDRRCRDVTAAIAELRVGSTNHEHASVYEAIQDGAIAVRKTIESLDWQASDPPAVSADLLAAAGECLNAIAAAEDYERELQAAWRALPDDDPRKAERPPERASSYGVRQLGTALDELIGWLESSVGRSLRARAYFLTGQAGSGKTHLLLDATRRALEAGRPAIFLSGAQFGRGDLWASIADQLGLEAVGADVLLDAMDAAGEASWTHGRRFVIFVDALNETTPPDFWRVHLPVLRAAIARHPHIAVVVSCRDTYEDLILDGNEAAHYMRRRHPGFAEREIEATQRYFAHYQLQAPKIPLLTPEFTLPLFLRMYCEGLSHSAGHAAPTGHQGRLAIFARYLDAKKATIARRLRPDAGSSYELAAARSQVGRVLDGLVDAMSHLGRETVSAETAEAVVRDALGDAAAEAMRVLGLLQDEGVLTRERLYLAGEGPTEGVRIVFQAFSDFLVLNRRLALSDDPLHDPAMKSWLADDCSWGVCEAATILFPERYGIEVPDLVGARLRDASGDGDDDKAWEAHQRAQQLYRSLVETLPYRDSSAITARTIELLNNAQRYFSRTEFYRVLFTLAPQPDNILNADGLHRYLVGRRMPQRDADFGFAMYHELSDEYSAASRLARWAAGGPRSDYDPRVVELACIPLCWLFSSPNRFMRDWVTKALVELLRGHLEVARALFERFWTVDDPYVVQRVVVISYGALLRSTPDQAGQAKALAELLYTTVFTAPIRADELLLDAARGIVRWAVAHALLPKTALESAQRPYGLKPPGPAPSQATLDAKYRWREGQPFEDSYASISMSLGEMGDFGRYVVEPGVGHFSRYRIGQEYPDRRVREPRFVKSRWKKFVASLSDEQKVAMAGWLSNPDSSQMSRFRFLRQPEDDPLSAEQRALFEPVYTYSKPVQDEYPVDKARRWLFRRALSLGWTPNLFAAEDRIVGGGRGREGHKAERWGKKYQWMAYHELLARVADNYQASRRFDDSEPYEGLHELIGDREIDPSLPPIDFRVFTEHSGIGATCWDPAPIELAEWPPEPLDFTHYRGDIKRFLADAQSEPSVAGSVVVRGRDDTDWIVLDSSVKKIDPLAHKGWKGLQERSGVDTVLLGARDAGALLAFADGKLHDQLRDVIDSHGHVDCCYVGEVGRAGPRCHHREARLNAVEINGRRFNAVSPVERYSWEGSILDCSIGETVTTLLPSAFVQERAGLTFDGRGPSWLDDTGTPVFTYYEEPGNESRALLVRAAFLCGFLAEHEVELIALHWFERMTLGGDAHNGHPSVESVVWARMPPDLSIRDVKMIRTERPGTI